MKLKSGFLFLAVVFALGSSLSISTVRAAQLSVTSFPEKLIVSAGDNRTIAFSVLRDGVKVPEARLKISLLEGSGTLETSVCHTDDTGQCFISYDAPATLEKGRVEAIATTEEGETGAVSVEIDVVEVPTLPGSGWQCDADQAVFTQIDNTTSCSDICNTKKDCSASKCLAGSEEYCYSAQEACGCIIDITAEKKDTTTGPTDIVADNANITAGALLSGFILVLFIISTFIYITAIDKEDAKQTRKLALVAMINLGIAIIIFSLAISRF